MDGSPTAWQTATGLLFLAGSGVGALLTWNAHRPHVRDARLSVVSFFAGWLTKEMPFFHLVAHGSFAAAFVLLGAMATVPGRLALLVSLVSAGGLVNLVRRASFAEDVLEDALVEGLGDGYRSEIRADLLERVPERVRLSWVLTPLPLRPRSVVSVRDIVYHRAAGVDLALDVHHHVDRPARAPVLLQIHGGGWVIGDKREQGLPLIHHLAARGWVCVNANYRLSPHATFPDHLIDLKHAIRWIREHGADYGADPSFLVVTGGSAGGHLAAMVGLTGDDPRYQPGFEGVSTRVQGCIPFYGIYDFHDRNGHWPHGGLKRLLERQVLKVGRGEDFDAFDAASPISRIDGDAPPFFVLHGDRDTLVPVKQARDFAAALRAVSREPVVYAELPGAQHAFEIFPSLRTWYVLCAVERFVGVLRTRHDAAQAAAAPATGGGLAA